MYFFYRIKDSFGAWVVAAVLCFSFVVLQFGWSAAHADSSANQSQDECAVLLAPLQKLHEDLKRIEAKLDSFVHPTWEYKVLTPNVIGDDVVDRYFPNLNPLGAQGWELVTYSPDIGYVLKRRTVRLQKKQ